MSSPHVSAIAHPVAMALAGEAPRVARRMAEMILLIYMVFDVYFSLWKTLRLLCSSRVRGRVLVPFLIRILLSQYVGCRVYIFILGFI